MTELHEGRVPPATLPAGYPATMVRAEDTRSPVTWRRRHAIQTFVGDLVGLVLAASGATITRFGTNPDPFAMNEAGLYTLLSAAFVITWLVVLKFLGAYQRKIMAEGGEEYRRATRAALLTFGLAASAATFTTFSLSRIYLAIFFTTGLIVTLLGRMVLRRRLRRGRLRGESLNRVLAIGSVTAASNLATSLHKRREHGYEVVGVWWPFDGPAEKEEVRLGDAVMVRHPGESTLDDALRASSADTVIVTDTERLGNDGLKSLGWALQGSGIDLLLSPSVVDVAGPRIHVRPVAHLPLIHLDEPRFPGASRLGKVLFDKTISTLALVLLGPVLLGVAATIKLTSRGPVLYRSTRVGIGGSVFEMCKFRTMVVDADDMVASLSHLDTGAGPMFKIRDDPRITKVGAVLRRFSIDELPQLLNVLRGEMSLVGPRPPLPSEVAQWEEGVDRRLLVRQGMTGLWQVNGRSDLEWQDGVHLDLDYVENWSMVRDLQIIWHTISAVLGSRGAY